MSHNKPRVVRINADELAHNTKAALIVLEISRLEVETLNIGSAIERLHVLTDSRENVLLYQESMALLFQGYDSDPRELLEIPEVRKYFQLLNAEWPHWLWYSVRETGAIALILSLLCDSEIVRSADGRTGTQFKSVNDVKTTILSLLRRGEGLFQTYQISNQMVEDSVDSALAEIGLG